MELMVFFFTELGLMLYSMIMYCPSMVATSAVYAARCTLNKSPLWSDSQVPYHPDALLIRVPYGVTLKCHTGFFELQLLDCAKLLVNFHSITMEGKQKVVFNKYSSP